MKRRDVPLEALAGLCLGFVVVVGAVHVLPFDRTSELPAVSAPDAPSKEITALAAQRAAGETRIFVCGASLTHGYPYTPPACYARQLGAGLRAVLPGREVVSLEYAKPALDSPKLAAMVERLVAERDPSLIVVTLGSNEFANRIFSGRNLDPQTVLESIAERASRARVLFRGLPRGKSAGDEQTDFQKSLAKRIDGSRNGKPFFGALPVPPEDERLLLIRMARAMRRMSATCQRADVPLVFCVAVYGLGGFWPWGISRGGWQPEVDALVRASWNGLDPAMLPRVEALLARLPERADLHFLHGLLLRSAGKAAPARRAFESARDLDTVPMHLNGRVLHVIRTEAERLGRPCLVLDDALAARSADGIQGPEHYLDYGHLDWHGHGIVAEFLASELATRGLVPALPDGWRPAFQRATVASLPDSIRDDTWSQARMAFSDSGFSMLFGNFRDALPYLMRAFRGDPQNGIWAARLLQCAYDYAGRRSEIVTRDQEANMRRAATLYGVMLSALKDRRLDAWLEGVLEGL